MMASKDVDEMSLILFTNLQLLGMDCIEMEGKYKIPFNKDMFHLPNKTGSEAVLHFLFDRLNPSLCKEQFRDCWPVLDRKTELQFRKVCNNWLTCIQKDESDAHMPRMNATLLLSPGGRKFIHMLYGFSTYVMVQVMKSEHRWKASDSLSYPTLHPSLSSLGSVVLAAIQDSSTRERQQFFKSQHINIAAKRKWKEYSDELVKGFRGLTKSCRDLEHEKRLQVNITAETTIKQGLSLPAKRTVTMFDSDRDVFSVKRGQRIEKIRSLWKQVSKFSDNMEEERETIQSVLDNSASKHILDGTDMGIRVPGLLLRECNKEIHKREIDSVYSGGRLNLVSVVLLWNICLKLYRDQLQSEDLPEVASEVAPLKAQVHKHHTYLVNTQDLREEMQNKTLPELKHSIEELRRHLNGKCSSKTSIEPDPSELGLLLTAPTPPFANAMKSFTTKDTPRGPVAGPISSNESPDALLAVVDNIQAAVRKDTQASVKDGAALAGLLSHTDRLVKEREIAHRTNVSNVKDTKGKSTKLKPSSKGSNLKKSSKDTQVRLPQMRDTVPVSSQIAQKHHKPPSVAAIPTTPKSSKQKALDILADSIVDSVLNPSSSTLKEVSDNFLSQFSELDEGALATRNKVHRTPSPESGKTQVFRGTNLSGGARPKVHIADDRNSTDTKYQSPAGKSTNIGKVSHRKKNFSVQESPRAVSPDQLNQTSQHTMAFNISQRQDLDYTEKDTSNNAADNLNSLQTSYRSVNGRDPKSLYTPKVSETLNPDSMKETSSESLNLATSKAFNQSNNNSQQQYAHSGSFIEHIFSTLQSPKQTTYNPSSSMDSSHNNLMHDGVSPLMQEVSSLTKSINRSEITNSPSTNGAWVSLSQSFQALGQNTHENIRYTPGNLSSPSVSDSSGKRNSDLSQNSQGFYISPVDLSDRRPGDGQASTDPATQSRRMVLGSKDNDEETEEDEEEETLDLRTWNMDLESSSVHLQTSLTKRPENDKSFTELQTSLNKSTQKAIDLGEKKGSPRGSSTRLSALSKKQQRDVDYQGSFSPNKSSGTLLKEIQWLEVSLEEDLTDIRDEKLTHLVDMEDDDLDSEQILDDSFVPFREGIQLVRHTPLKSSFSFNAVESSPGFQHKRSSPTNAAWTPLVNSVPDPEDNIQAKLALLQQKVTAILGTSLEENEGTSLRELTPSPGSEDRDGGNQGIGHLLSP